MSCDFKSLVFAPNDLSFASQNQKCIGCNFEPQFFKSFLSRKKQNNFSSNKCEEINPSFAKKKKKERFVTIFNFQL